MRCRGFVEGIQNVFTIAHGARGFNPKIEITMTYDQYSPDPETFDAMPYIKEIARVFPTVRNPVHRECLAAAGFYFLHNFPKDNPLRSEENMIWLPRFLESVRCCGVSPEGCPPVIPPSPFDVVHLAPVLEVDTAEARATGSGFGTTNPTKS